MPSYYLRGLQSATVFAGVIILTQALHGQDALRTAIQGDRAYQARNAADYLPEQNRLHAGPVEFQASVAYGLEWNDNVSLRPNNEDADLIQRPQVNLLAAWPVSETSRLSFGAGIGYEVYLDHPELGGLVVTPNSEFAWDIRVEDFVFTIYDRISYSQDVLSQGTINGGTSEFPRIENTGGLRMRWYPARYVFEVGYGHYNFLSFSSGSTNSTDFDYLDRSAEQFFGRAGIRFAEATTTGIEASASLTDYKTDVQSDNTSLSVGPFVEWQATETLNLSLRGGAVFYSFDPNSNQSVTNQSAGSDLSSYYFGLTTQHQLTEHIRQGISFVRDVQQGLNQGSDYIEQFVSRYFVNWGFHRSASVAVDIFYENSNEPQDGVTTIYNRLGAGLGLNLRPTDHVGVGLGYRFTIRDSDEPNSNYDQNLVSLNFSYQF